jgi:uncharacterized protein (TIGR03546 family)
MFWLNWSKGLLGALNADTTPEETASAFALGATLGLMPKGNLSTFIIFLITWVIRVNVGVAMLAMGLFTLIGYATDPLTEKIGFFLLSGIPALRGFWTALYNTPVLPYFAFNNTLVLGNLVAGLILAAPLYYLGRHWIFIYHTRYRERVLNSRFMKMLAANDTVQKYKATYDKWIKR